MRIAIAALALFACHHHAAQSGTCDGGTPGSASCGLGQSCRTSADCSLGNCLAGACSAPANGPSPTGAVSQTIAPDGGTISVVSGEHVALSVQFPAGALKKPALITLTPLSPSGANWIEVGIEPAGQILLQPAKVTIALPPGVPFIGGNVGLANATDTEYVAATASGNTLTAEVRSLGIGNFGGDTAIAPVRSADTTPTAGDRIFALDLPVENLLFLARSQYAVFHAVESYDKAAQLAGTLSAIAQKVADEPDAQQYLSSTAADSCSGLNAALATLQSGTYQCPAQLQIDAEKALSWVAVGQAAVSGPASACPALSDPKSSSFYDVVTAAKANELASALRSGAVSQVQFRTCQCKFIPHDKWTVSMQRLCPGWGVPSIAPAGDTGSGVGADSLLFVGEDEADLDALGLATDAQAESNDLAAPLVSVLLGEAHDECVANGDPAAVGRLLARLPGNAAAIADAQICASPLSAGTVDHAGAPIASASIGPGAAPADTVSTATLKAIADGSVQLSGPIAALRCVAADDSETAEADALVIQADGHEAKRLSPTGGAFLASALSLQMSDLFTAAGADPATAKQLTLTVVRDSPGCGGLYGPTPVVLFTLTLAFGCNPPAPASYCITEVNPPSSFAAGYVGMISLIEDGSLLIVGYYSKFAIWKHGTSTLLPQTVPGQTDTATVNYLQMNSAGTVLVNHTTHQDPTLNCYVQEVLTWNNGVFTTLPSPDNGAIGAAINDSGVVVGMDGVIATAQGCPTTKYASIWPPGASAPQLVDPSTSDVSYVYDINAAGDAVGSVNGHPVLWPAGGGAAVTIATSCCAAYSIDDFGTVLWQSGSNSWALYTARSGAVPLPGDLTLATGAPNNHGISLGQAGLLLATNTAATPAYVIFNTRDGSRVTIDNSLVDPSLGWDLTTFAANYSAQPKYFDRHGRLFGYAYRNGTWKALILTPAGAPEP